MTPPEIMCPAPPPPPPTLAPNSPTNGHTDDRADLLQAIRCGTTLKKVPQATPNSENGTSPRINGVVNGNSTKEPPKTIKGMDSVQEELCNHLKAKENGTLKKKPPAMQPIVKRLLTEKPTESARKDDSERRMMNHGKRNFVVQKSMPNGVSEKKIEEPKEPKEPKEVAEKKVVVSIKPFEAPNKEVQEFKRVSESLKPIQTTISTPPDTPDRVQSPEREVKVLEKETKKHTVTLKPLQMPQKSPEPMSPQRINSVDISKIIRTPTTPQSPAATRVKMNHGKPNYTLPTRIKTPKADSRKLPLEFLSVKLRETPNSPLQETVPVPLAVDSPSGDTSHLPPFRSVTLGRKRENPPPSPLVPAAPTYDTPKYDQKIVVSFAMDLAATPNRYPDHVKKSLVQNGAEASDAVADLRQKKFTIDPNRLSVREQ